MRSSQNTSPTSSLGWTRLILKTDSFLLHMEHIPCHSGYCLIFDSECGQNLLEYAIFKFKAPTVNQLTCGILEPLSIPSCQSVAQSRKPCSQVCPTKFFGSPWYPGLGSFSILSPIPGLWYIPFLIWGLPCPLCSPSHY